MSKNLNLATTVANVNAQEGASVESNNQVAEKQGTGKTASKKKCPLDRVLEYGRKLYERQLAKNSNTWREVIERSIQVRYPMGSYTLQNFLIDYGKRVYRLLDSKRFEHDCKENNLNVFVAATHIALQPKTRIYAVLDDGLNSKEAGLSSYLVDMTKPIFEYQDFPNAEKLLGYKPDSVETTPASAA